jgi:hypothetical protein
MSILVAECLNPIKIATGQALIVPNASCGIDNRSDAAT